MKTSYQKAMACLNIRIKDWCEVYKKTREDYKNILRKRKIIDKSLSELTEEELRNLADTLRLELDL